MRLTDRSRPRRPNASALLALGFHMRLRLRFNLRSRLPVPLLLMGISFGLSISACEAPAPAVEGSSPDSGMDMAAIDSAADLFRVAVEADELRGAVIMVTRRGQVVLSEAYGWRDMEAGLPMEQTTLFRMASNTKAIVATAALMLADEGRLSLQDPVGRFIPEFDEGELAAITIHHLLTHTSGLPRSPIFIRPVDPGSSLREEAGRFGRELALVREPGTGYGYSNVGYNVLGGVIEAVSEQPLENFLRERIYLPLGMADSNNHESSADHARMSKVYRGGAGSWAAGWSPGDEPDYPIVRASGGLISTAGDYARFLQGWLDGGRVGDVRLISEESVGAATRSHTAGLNGLEDGEGYGYGWQIPADGGYAHSGSDGTFVWIDPELELTGIIFTQSPGGGSPQAEFIERVRAAVIE